MSRHTRIHIAGALLLFGVVLGTAAGARAFLIAPSDGPEVSLPVSGERSVHVEKGGSDPVRLSIPSIGVEARIEHTGITARGTMAVPDSYSAVGWYRYGALPGEDGSAVIAGHLDNGAGLSAVFASLDELEEGDDVFVATQSGEQLHFIVVAVREYPYHAVPVEELFEKDDAAWLNLVTCAGEWLQDERTYDKRLVVYTVLVPPEE